MKSFLKFCFFILFTNSFLSCEVEYIKPIQINYQNQSIDKKLAADQELNAFIEPYREKISSEMQSVLSYAPNDMFKTDTKYNTAIGNMMADAVLEKANPVFEEKYGLQIDAVLLNYGGIRSGISEGDVTVRTAFDIMPFENEIKVVELPYHTAQKMLKYMIEKRTAHPIAGMKIHLNHNYSLHYASINGDEIKLNDRKEKSYYIATSDYLLQGGDNMIFFEENTKVFSLDYKIRNLLIDYFKSNKEIKAKQDGRFSVGNPKLN